MKRDRHRAKSTAHPYTGKSRKSCGRSESLTRLYSSDISAPREAARRQIVIVGVVTAPISTSPASATTAHNPSFAPTAANHQPPPLHLAISPSISRLRARKDEPNRAVGSLSLARAAARPHRKPSPPPSYVRGRHRHTYVPCCMAIEASNQLRCVVMRGDQAAAVTTTLGFLHPLQQDFTNKTHRTATWMRICETIRRVAGNLRRE